jgi:hypothetical protein
MVVDTWNATAEVTAILRAHYGPAIYEKFEYLLVLSQAWISANPQGTYPRAMKRVDLPNKWRVADEQYAASLARSKT